MNNKDTVEISLPREVAVWLICHCDKNLVQLGDVLADNERCIWHDWAVSEMRYFRTVYRRLSRCVTKREILAFWNK